MSKAHQVYFQFCDNGNIRQWGRKPFQGGQLFIPDTHHLQFITQIRDALGPECQRLMIDELPDYIRQIAEKGKAK